MASTMQVDSTDAIDEGLYSRQLYVLGKEAMQKMATSNVLLVGVGGVGVEIAKNVALAGVKSLALWDPNLTRIEDLASQFYLTADDIDKPRAEASAPRISELNSYVPVSVVYGNPRELAKDYQVVVMSEGSLEDAVALNNACRSAGSKFIWVGTRGLTGFLFNDFGPDFTVIDVDGEEPITGVIAQIDSDGEVFAPESARHGLDSGSFVEIYEAEPASLNGEYKISAQGPLSFNIGKLSAEHTSGGLWRQIKKPAKISFKPLSEQLASPEYFITDFAKFDRPSQLHITLLALNGFMEKHGGELPRAYRAEDATEVIELAKNVSAQYPDLLGDAELNTDLVATVAKQSRGDLAPVNAVLGGMAAQEVLKAVSGKFSPVNQFMYYDALEALPKDVTAEDAAPKGSRYDNYYATFGKQFMDKLANLQVFLVGAGAIGCEVLKNWALLGLGSGPRGHITVTDNDIIERSNLNRQFLFRPKDVGRPKSETAATAVASMNPDLTGHFTAMTDKVGPDTQTIFNDKLWKSFDLVTNALDNVEARTYVDRRCVYYLKPLIESGTLGTKGNVQVVVPDLTESYSSSHDPPEKGIPLCTLRSFPSKIDHTIAWAKNLFEDLFDESPQNVNLYLTQPNYVESTLKQSANQKGTLETIYSYLVADRPLTFEQCIFWAVKIFEKWYRDDILQLLYNFPPDATTASGAPFWAPPKRLPKPAELDINDPHHFEFVRSAANLRAFNFGLKGESSPDVFIAALENYKSPEFVPSSSVKIQADDSEPDPNEPVNTERDELVKIAEQLPAPSTLAGFRLQPAEFEKDDDTNFHIDFIDAASNLRAANYQIDTVDKSKTKFIAGRIIPAIATTTALVTGLSTLEAVKVVQGKTLEEYKNGFVNLALPFFGFSEPIASTKIKYNGDKTIDKIWGRFDIEGDVTLQQLLDYFKKEHGLEISMIASDSLLLYASFHPPKKVQERLPLTITELVKLISKKPPAAGADKSIVLEITADDEDDEEVDDLPFVVVRP